MLYKQSGFTYIGLLIVIAIAGIGLSAVGVLWQTEMQREREKELLFVGRSYAKAIASYYASTPGGIAQLPMTLEDLVLDKRFPVIKRHLRKRYADPMTGDQQWGLLKQQNRIIGVYSLSDKKPIKVSGLNFNVENSGQDKSYKDWQFVYSNVH